MHVGEVRVSELTEDWSATAHLPSPDPVRVATAADLRPGDAYRALDGIDHTVKAVWTSGIRTYVVHTTGEERVLFPNARVEVQP